ncbi:hypothetical protein [Streptomyces sp. NPDC017964]|uniref:hypothetical protein n=1 Tax=Streptomyces sp. NPDC017964 TaxID=3365022 RepID=UPI0037A3AE1C
MTSLPRRAIDAMTAVTYSDVIVGTHNLDTVVAEHNSRPRKTLGWETPAERLSILLATTRQ